MESLLSPKMFPQILRRKQKPFNYTKEVKLKKVDSRISNNQDMKKNLKISHTQFIKIILFFSNPN